MSANSTATSSLLTADNINKVGLGYGIAIAVGILVLISTIMLASYVCFRLHGRGIQQQSSKSIGTGGSDGAGVGRTTVQLILMDDRANPAEWSIGGLDQATLETYPKIVYSEKQVLPPPQDTS